MELNTIKLSTQLVSELQDFYAYNYWLSSLVLNTSLIIIIPNGNRNTTLLPIILIGIPYIINTLHTLVFRKWNLTMVTHIHTCIEVIAHSHVLSMWLVLLIITIISCSWIGCTACHIQPLSISMKALILTNALVRFVLLVQNNICRCLIILAFLHLDTHIIRNLTRANSVTTNEQAVATPYVLCSSYLRKCLYTYTSYRIFIKHSRIVRASESIVVKCLAFAWNILPFAYTTHVALVYLRIPRRTITQHALVWVNWLIEIN